MNIFQVLSQGKSRLHEVAISAMLGYLLDSSADHGLSDAVIRRFLEAQDNPNLSGVLDQSFIHTDVLLEQPYTLQGSRKEIDIQISLFDSSKQEIYRIIIENKIKAGAANAKQLDEYYRAILEDEQDIKNLHIVFLTPVSKVPQLIAEYENLILTEPSHSKNWMYWKTDDDDDSSNDNPSIVSIIRDILNRESTGLINPINEYIRHTLKAFAQHATSFASNGKTIRTRGNLGEIEVEVEITMQDQKRYKVQRRNGGQIQVFNLETDLQEIARPLLRKYVAENDLQINSPNTRNLGKKVIEWIQATSS